VKIVQVTPHRNNKRKLKSLLIQKERDLRGRATFFRQRAGRWQHKTYPGWINWDEASGGILVAEVQCRAGESEWQLLQAFVGYLDRHFSDEIESITITYR
jgi:hypothetical protein